MRVRDVLASEHGTYVAFMGFIVTSRRVTAATKNGKQPMGFVTAEDETGIVETVWFPAAYRQCGTLIEHGGAILLRGVVQIEFGLRTVSVDCAAAVPDDEITRRR